MDYIEKCCRVKKQGEGIVLSEMEVISMHQVYALQYEVIFCIASTILTNSSCKQEIRQTDFIHRVLNLINSDAGDMLRCLCISIIFESVKV